MTTTRKQRRQVKGEPWVWLSGGAVAVGIVMIVGIVTLITTEGTAAFWPHNLDAYVLGEARFHVHHPEHGQVWISRDDTQLVVPGANLAFRRVDGRDAPADVGRPQRASVQRMLEHREVLRQYEDREWRLRDRLDRMLRGDDGLALDLDVFLASPEEFRPGIERDRDDWLTRIYLEDAEHGEVFLPDSNDMVLVPVPWRFLDMRAVPFDFEQPRQAAIADFRELRNLFGEAGWLLAQPNGNVVRDDQGEPVLAKTFIDQPERFPSPWGYFDEQGKKVSLDTMLGDDRWRDYRVLVGAPRGSPRAMDIRELPPNPDGTPVKPFQLSTTPMEYLIRQGNQGNTLYNEQQYFRWVRTDMPDIQAVRRYRTSTHNDTVLAQVSLPNTVLLERLEGGILTGFIRAVTVEGETVAELERDGLEATWRAFEREQSRMRQEYLERYRIQNKDIGHVNFKIKARDDAMKRVRYEHRDSRNAVTMIDRLNELHNRWQLLEPTISADTDVAEADKQIDEWLNALKPMLDEWRTEVEAFEGLTDTDRTAMREAEALQLERSTIQAREFKPLSIEVDRRRAQEQQATFDFVTADGRSAAIPLSEIVRAFRPNERGLFGKLGIYFDRVKEFLTDDPRQSNTEGGIWPVILGTLIMTLLMCVAVVPFGVIAALYLREYAKQGPIVSAVRIAVNNLAGVPSIVFGIFGLGFFCWIMGGTIDDLFFPELKPAPIFGGGGILWASLTLALLTVPVVIVATEEALSAVPSSQREASLACGASKFQTIWKVILPQALPGVLTGTILAMARGAGEVAPLMLVGAVKYAPYPPVDAIPPFVHLERKFMHLGFHVYDVGFQSPNVDNTKPLVFATALVLMLLIAVLNIFAISLRNRLRRKFATSAV